MSTLTVIGIDLAKARFQIFGADARGKGLFNRSIQRAKVLEFLVTRPRCQVAMEACAGSHFWARKIRELGHEVKIIPARFVTPFRRGNKNDAADAEAIAEASGRPNIHFVEIKEAAQLDLQALHRVRERLVGNRTALCNQIRSLLGENGIYLPQGVHSVTAVLPMIHDRREGQELSPMARETFADLHSELLTVEEKIAIAQRRIEAAARSDETCVRLQTVPGVGPISATAIRAAVGNPRAFKNGRQFAAWLGLVPRHQGTGGKTKLLGISKRGNSYIRKLLVQGAHSSLLRAPHRDDRRSAWSLALLERRGRSKAVVALANRNARTIYRLLADGTTYDAR